MSDAAKRKVISISEARRYRGQPMPDSRGILLEPFLKDPEEELAYRTG